LFHVGACLRPWVGVASTGCVGSGRVVYGGGQVDSVECRTRSPRRVSEILREGGEW